MVVRNSIWEKIKEADVFYRCALGQASKQRKLRFIYKLLIPFLAALCALFTKLNMPNYTFWTALLICMASILKSFFTQIILSERDIDRLDKIGVDYGNFRTKYEDLMRKLDNGEISEKEASKEFEKQESLFGKKKSDLNKLVLWIPFWEKKYLQKSSEDYLKKVHYNNYTSSKK